MIHFTINVIINQKPLTEVKLTNKQEQNVCWSSRPHREKFHPKSMVGERVKIKIKIHKRRSTGEEYLPKNAAEGPTHQEWSQVDDKRRIKTLRGRRGLEKYSQQGYTIFYSNIN